MHESQNLLRERNQTKKTTYFQTPFIENSQKFKLNSSDRMQISDFLGMTEGTGRCGTKGLQKTTKKGMYVITIF